MTTNNPANMEVQLNSDGMEIKGGATPRKLKWSGADITITGSGIAIVTFPTADATLLSNLDLDTDGTLAANSDSKVATQKATKTYADTKASSSHTHKSSMLLGTLGGDQTVGAGATVICKPWGNALNSPGTWNVAIPKAGTYKNLYFRVMSAQPATGSLTCTIAINGVDTAIVATVPAGQGAGGLTVSDTTHSVAVNAGDVIWFGFQNNAPAAASAGIVSAVIELELATGTPN